jgi:hypothetical protein
MATHATVWTGILSNASSSLSVGYAVVKNGNVFLPATTANRASYGRAVGVSISSADTRNPAFEYQVAGVIAASVTGLGAGSASWVRASSTGTLERCTPASGDDLVGKCNAAGDLQVNPGVWDSDNASGGGGGGGSVPTGTGFVHVTGGSQDAAAKLVENADVHASAAIAVTKLAAGAADTVLKGGASNAFGKVVNADIDAAAAIALSKTALSANAQAFLGTPSSANLRALVTDETGSGAAVFGTQPTLDRPVVHEIEDPTSHSVSIGGDGIQQLSDAGIYSARPRLGLASGTVDGVSFAVSSPFSSDGYVEVDVFNGGSTHVTISAAQAAATCLEFYGASGARSVYFPEVTVGDDWSYAKDLYNNSGYTITVCVNDAQPSSLTTATLADGEMGRFWFTAAGVLGPFAPAGGASAAGSTANEIQTTDGAGAFQAATNVKAGSGYVSVGATPATTGAFRLSKADSIKIRNNANDTDVSVFAYDTVYSSLNFGSNTGGADHYAAEYRSPNYGYYGNTTGGTFIIVNHVGTEIAAFINSTKLSSLSPTLYNSLVPRVGLTSPYASEGRATQAMADANQTLASSVYSRRIIRFTGALTANRTATFPHPASEDASYEKIIRNDCTGSQLVISTGTGTTVTLNAGEKSISVFTPDGVADAY